MLLADFVFLASHFEIHPAVHLNTSIALTSLQLKDKTIKTVKKDIKRYNSCGVPGCTKQAHKNCNIITVTIIIML